MDIARSYTSFSSRGPIGEMIDAFWAFFRQIDGAPVSFQLLLQALVIIVGVTLAVRIALRRSRRPILFLERNPDGAGCLLRNLGNDAALKLRIYRARHDKLQLELVLRRGVAVAGEASLLELPFDLLIHESNCVLLYEDTLGRFYSKSLREGLGVKCEWRLASYDLASPSNSGASTPSQTEGGSASK